MSMGSVSPSRIIFANPCKATSFIRHAAKAGVDAMTFDNADELEKISRVYPDAKLILRILTDDSKSVCRLGIKFGASLQTVPRLLARARELNLNVVGVSFHVGSGCYDPTSFIDAITSARKVFDMGKSYGYDFTLLDIGGGFEDESLERTANVIRLALSKSFGELIEGGLKVIAEPGRFFVSSAFTLAANVIARRCGSSEESDDRVQMVEAAEGGSSDPQVMCKSLIFGTERWLPETD
jgi:ornithine decarboxylase